MLMMRELIARLVTCAVLVVLLLTVDGVAHALVHNGKLNVDKVIATEQTIQIVRGLHLNNPVGFALTTPDALARMLSTPQPGQPSDEEIAALGAAGGMLGLYPKGVDLKAESVKTLKTQLVAFYDFRTKKMMVIDNTAVTAAEDALEREGQRDYIGYLILAHEFTHALQDQNFGLGDRLMAIQGNGDRALALRSVAEGDATLAGWGYVTGGMEGSTVTTLGSRLDDAIKGFSMHQPDLALAAYEYFNFPYSEGLRFVGEAYRRGGWAAVDALYRDPPTSTQQIIDPSLYFDHPSAPAEVTLGGYEGILAGWSVAERDVWGELGLQVILQRNFGMNASVVALARRWAGDGVVVMRKGAAYTVLWLVVFRDDDTARQFARAYRSMLNRTLGSRTPHLVECRSQAVLVVAGAPAGDTGFAQSVWTASTIRDGVLPAAQ